jgi:hypothetical protein
MFKKIANNEELPSPEKLKALRAAFIRMIKGLREKKKIRQEDLRPSSCSIPTPAV